jgi:hypothetical protein
MAQLHAKGFYPLDFTGGNILTNADGSRMQIVDLNRMKRCRHISIKQGLKQARKLIISDSERQLLHDAYIQARQTP